MTVSLLGDGIYFVAIAWQVYELENAATALSVVGLAFSAPLVGFMLLGGLLSDRVSRKRLMIISDVLRGAAITVIGMLSVAGSLELWHMYILVAFYGAGEALFVPAFGAIVPDLVPKHLLGQANALHQFVRPFALRLVGPAVGGWLISVVGTGEAFILDGATFFFSALMILLIRATPPPVQRTSLRASAVRELLEGFTFVRSRAWLWGTIASATLGILVFMGPFEVLVPFIVKNELAGDAGDLGAVFAAGGLGSIAASFLIGQRGLPRKHMTFMYVVWTAGMVALGFFALSRNLVEAMLLSALMWTGFTAGMIVWGTLIHRLVPSELLGRVTSFDWMLSLAGTPISFAATGPVAEALGARTTLFWAGLLGAVATLGFLFLPGMRDTERDGSLHEEEPVPEPV